MRFLYLGLIILLSGGVFAAPSEKELKEIQTQLRQEKQTQTQMKEMAQSVANQVSSVQRQMVKTANQIQNNEDVLSALEHDLNELKENKKKLEERLFARENQMTVLMSGLQKMAFYPPDSVFFAPQNPVDNLRSSLILKSTKQPLKATSDNLKEQLMKLASLEAAIKTQASQIKLAATRLENEQAAMEKLVSQKSILQAHFESESIEAKKNAEDLGKKAKNLEDLLKKLEKERQAKNKRMADAASRQKPILNVPQPMAVAGAFAKSKGSLPLPVRGRVVQKYGDTTIGGGSAKGITMHARQSAQVVAPFDGTVLFAGPFKDYGNLIIIEHGEDYHTLLSGLTRIDCMVGQSVLTGEPVGVMSAQKPEKLYIEFRQNGLPINPSGWFASKI